ncbi:dihydropteroate synthase [Parapedobacter composti]|uniref:Dihydropteroate synthase n=1 Tax=Parapedobacter composti TaxID=623281 RepID=A0A1I1FAD0_9SPHI|nr:dihydropteroate synthase [Parapedobacter composti]SFB95906.1 dihydropteroate synthase [Parapedobacter composti]
MNAGGTLIDLSTPKVMGILNITPDSFFDGGRYHGIDNALLQAEKLLDEGADILDIGAYSSRPGAAEVSPAEEQARLIPVIEACRRQFPDAILSVDTFRADVARSSIAAGAHLINDISGGTLDHRMFATIAELQVPYILMHMRGTPNTMQQLTDYTDVVQEINLYFGKQVAALRALGIKDIILDPGFGFAKTLEQNYELLRRINELHVHGLPILGGISRKSMIYKKLKIGPEEALNGTTVLNTVLLTKGIKLLRVHDAKAAKEAITLLQQAALLP